MRVTVRVRVRVRMRVIECVGWVWAGVGGCGWVWVGAGAWVDVGWVGVSE